VVYWGGNANNGANAGLGYANSNNGWSNSNSNIGSRHTMKKNTIPEPRPCIIVVQCSGRYSASMSENILRKGFPVNSEASSASRLNLENSGQGVIARIGSSSIRPERWPVW